LADKLGIKVLFDYKQSYKELDGIINKLNKTKVNIPLNMGGSGSGSNSGLSSGKTQVKEISNELLKVQDNLNALGKFDLSKTPIDKGMKIIGYSTKEVGKNFENFTQSLNNGQNQIVTYSGTINKLNGNMELTGRQIRQTNRENNTFSKDVGIALKRIAEWAIATQVIYGSIKKFREGVKFVYELSNSLNEIRIVTGKTADSVERLGREYNQLAKIMGVGTQDITKASVEFYRQGLTQEEVMNRTETATKYAKITNEDFTQSAEILTAVVNSMGVDIERASDVMTFLGDATATSGAEIGRAMQKVAGSAGALNIPFEKITSYIAVISSKTRESAESIGTSMKALLARFQNLTETGWNEEDETRINDVAKALKAVNISLTDGEGQIRRFDLVVEQLGTKWDGLDTNTKAYLATTLAGARQQSRFYNLMDGLTEATTLYNKALQATGTTNEKFGIYLESNESKANKLKATWEELFLNTFNSEQIGKFIEMGIGLVQFSDGVGLVNIAIIALSATIIIFSNNIVKSLVAVQNFIKGIATMNWTLAAINPVVSGLALAIGGLIIAFNLYKKHQQKMYDNAIKNAKAFSDESTEADKLMKSISDLANKESLSVDEKTRMGRVTAELQKMYPSVFANLDMEKIKYEDLASAVKLATDEKRREALQDIENEKTKLKAQINNVERETFSSGFAGVITPAKEKATIDRINGLKQKLSELNAMSAEVMLGGSSSGDIESNRLKYGSTTTKTPNASGVRGGGDKADSEKPYQSLYNTIRDLNFELSKQQEILSQTEDSDQIPILKKRNEMLEQQQDNLHKLNVARNKELATLKVGSDRHQELTDMIQSTSLEWWKLESAIDANLNVMDDFAKKAEELETKTLEEQTKNLEDVQKQIVEIIKKRYELELDEADKAHKKKLDKLDKELDKYKSNIQEQIDAIDKLRDAEDFSKNQNKITGNISTLTNERNTLAMAASSGDLVAINRIKEIDKELSENRENLLDLQQDREDELRKQALQNSLDEKEQKIKNAKEAEEKRFEIIKTNYEKLLQEGNLYTEANKTLTTGMVTDINGKLVTVQEAFVTFSNTFGETLGVLGGNLQSEFVGKLEKAKALLDSMGSININTTGSFPQYANGTKDAIGGMSIVGENGAELINLPKHSQVFPADITQKILSGFNNFMPNLSMPKIPSMAGVGGSGNLNFGNINIYAQNVDNDSIGDITNKIMHNIKREYSKLGGGWKP
jgi:TP901 family phage tail tape measure protein